MNERMNEKGEKKKKIYGAFDGRNISQSLLMMRNSRVKVDTKQKFLDPFVTRQASVQERERKTDFFAMTQIYSFRL